MRPGLNVKIGIPRIHKFNSARSIRLQTLYSTKLFPVTTIRPKFPASCGVNLYKIEQLWKIARRMPTSEMLHFIICLLLCRKNHMSSIGAICLWQAVPQIFWTMIWWHTWKRWVSKDRAANKWFSRALSDTPKASLTCAPTQTRFRRHFAVSTLLKNDVILGPKAHYIRTTKSTILWRLRTILN